MLFVIKKRLVPCLQQSGKGHQQWSQECEESINAYKQYPPKEPLSVLYRSWTGNRKTNLVNLLYVRNTNHIAAVNLAYIREI